ncbi:hypothetical protein ACF0H5_010101 [Mactra antiquata]
MKVYISGQRVGNGTIVVPLPSAVILYILNYCKSRCFHVVLVNNKHNEESVTVQMSGHCLQLFEHSFVSLDKVPVKVANCVLPVIEDSKDYMIRCGLCCVIRHIVKVTHNALGPDDKDSYIDLLGFRAASLKACSEVSGWTKLCEVELPLSISHLITTLQGSNAGMTIDIPEDVMKLELHFDKPPLLHNDDKKKRVLLKSIQQKYQKDFKELYGEKKSKPESSSEKTNLPEDGTKTELSALDKDAEFIQQFFKTYENHMPHGSSYYRVQTKSERDLKKFQNSNDGKVCKFGCTENKLVKWCAKCNDREKLRQKEKIQQMNNSRLIEHGDNKFVTSDAQSVPSNHKSELSNGDSNISKTLSQLSLSTNGEKRLSDFGVSMIDELSDYVSSLTLYDVIYEHVYAEGVGLTISDLALLVYIYYLMESLEFKCSTLFLKLSNIKKWLTHILTLPRIQHTANVCGFNLVAMETAVMVTSHHTESPMFTIPSVILNVEEDTNEISRSAKAKHKALKKETMRVLEKVKEQKLEPEVGSHPCGDNVQLDWSSVPLHAHPKIELPEKRVGRKCEQLENLATAVKSVSKSGDIIVDFCSGAGHLGIIIAHLLPDCQVYLIENKEESLVRAQERVKELQLNNVTCYQCNLDYFQGPFNVGVCLHACGVATDLVLQQCLDKNASFVICPCCYGNIQNTHLISYPRSINYRNSEFTDKDVIILGHAADQTEIDIELHDQGRYCMNLVDTDRADLARENGYNVTLCSLKPLSCTPKNNLLVGSKIYQEQSR